MKSFGFSCTSKLISWACISKDDKQVRILERGKIKPPKADEEELVLTAIYKDAQELMEEWKPDLVGIKEIGHMAGAGTDPLRTASKFTSQLITACFIPFQRPVYSDVKQKRTIEKVLNQYPDKKFQQALSKVTKEQKNAVGIALMAAER